MKKIIAALIIMLLAVPVFADGDFGSFAMTAGYSSKDSTALMGMNGTYQFLASAGSGISLGGSAHTDIAFGLNHQDTATIFIGTLAGLALEWRVNPSFAINISVGPAIVAETGVTEPSIGIGAGLDAVFSYFFGEGKSAAISGGATVYPQFFVSDDARSTSFSIAAMGWIGMSFRYPAPVSAFALPAIGYLIS